MRCLWTCTACRPTTKSIPTILISLTYSFFFGFMFGDVGQGLCLMIGGFLLYHFKKINLAGINSRCGLFSVLFGFLFGSLFGFEDVIPALWLRPREAMMQVPFVGRLNTVFIIAVGIGMCVILLTMVLNIINSCREHDPEKIWFDTNGVAGLVFYGSPYGDAGPVHDRPRAASRRGFGGDVSAAAAGDLLQRTAGSPAGKEKGHSSRQPGDVLCPGIFRTV